MRLSLEMRVWAGELERRIGESTFRRYARYYRRESPRGIEQAIALLTATVANSRRTKSDKPVTVDDVMPERWGRKIGEVGGRSGNMTDRQWERFKARYPTRLKTGESKPGASNVEKRWRTPRKNDR